MKIEKVCVYCGSSQQAAADYMEAAEEMGAILALENITIVYGGGSAGLMGRLADEALSKGGRVIGVIPEFMIQMEWAHPNVTELQVVGDLRERKERMIAGADAIIAMPGGCGTFEELFEAITLKRLGLFLNPIVLLNTKGFFVPLIELLEHAITEYFMAPRHREMWSVAETPRHVIETIRTATRWPEDARSFAAL